MAVNVSGRQLLDPGIVDEVASAIADSGIDAKTVVLEITESVLLPGDGTMIERLNALSDLGVHLYIDDFGTGYSSLSYLQMLPVNGLKLAQEFVETLPGGDRGGAGAHHQGPRRDPRAVDRRSPRASSARSSGGRCSRSATASARASTSRCRCRPSGCPSSCPAARPRRRRLGAARLAAATLGRAEAAAAAPESALALSRPGLVRSSGPARRRSASSRSSCICRFIDRISSQVATPSSATTTKPSTPG
jgi:hypothetical protein